MIHPCHLSTLPGGSEIPGLPDLDLSLPALDLGGEGTSETPEGGLELPDTEGESATILQPQKKQPQKKRKSHGRRCWRICISRGNSRGSNSRI